MSTVAIQNVGPIRNLEFDVPDDGGVVVLRGANGCGKSLTLDATSRLLGGNARPPVNDQAAKGKASGWGAKITIGQKISKGGELMANSLEGSFDLATLVDPGIDDAVAADAKRIKALLGLLGFSGDESLFYSLVGGDAAYDQLGVEPSDDIVTLASRVKRKLESGARNAESQADKLQGKADSLKSDIREFPVEVKRDAESLNASLESAIRSQASLEEQTEAAIRDADSRERAKAQLNALPLPSVKSAATKAAECGQECLSAGEAVVTAQQSLVAAQEALNRATFERDRAQLAHEKEKQIAGDRSRFHEILDKSSLQQPIAEELAEGNRKVEETREAVTQGALARAADAKLIESESVGLQARSNKEQADRLRDQAHGVDDVLSDAVGQLDVGLFVRGGRLCKETDRGATPIGELSHGERWKLAIDLGVKRVGERGVLAIPQEAWEGMDGSNRGLVHNHARKRGVVILTAEATDGELRAECLQ